MLYVKLTEYVGNNGFNCSKLNSCEISSDDKVAEYLGLSLDEYIGILKKFGATRLCNEYVFAKREDLKECLQYFEKEGYLKK